MTYTYETILRQLHTAVLLSSTYCQKGKVGLIKITKNIFVGINYSSEMEVGVLVAEEHPNL